MPTKRTPLHRPPSGGNITPEVIEAWRYLRQEEESKGDTMEYAEARAAFHKRLGIKIGSPWPIDVWDPEPPEAFTKAQDAWAKQRYLKAWRRAYELNCELERLAFE